MPISIRARLTATFTLVIVVVLVIANLILSGYSRRLAVRRADRALHEGSKSLAHAFAEEWDEAAEDAPLANGASGPQFDTSLPIQEAIQHTRLALSEDRIDFVVIERKTGKVIRSDVPQSGLAWPIDTRSGWRVRVTELPAPQHSREFGMYMVVTGVPWYRIAADLKTQEEQVGEICLFIVVLFATATWLLVGYTLQPIAQLAEQARVLRGASMAATERIRLSAPSSDVEVVRLVGTLNLLLENLAESAESKARFYTAASHELRTPLHVLCGQLELTLSRPRSAEAYESAIIEAQSQATRLSTIIESLLLLNRLDRGTPEAAESEVNLEAICAGQMQIFAPLIETRRLGVVSTFLQSDRHLRTLATAPEMHVEILLRNLIENAVKYATPGGQIQMNIWHPLPDGPPAFSIYNDAAAIEPSEFERLGEPFYRLDTSRSSQSGGNGLGISICRALAEANNWKLTLRQEKSGMTVIVLFDRQRA